MVDRVGQQLGNYRLMGLLGRGGFAEVYLGEHLRLKTQAAIKVLHTPLEEDDAEGFLHEARTLARLKHPHIVRVFDFDVENHTPFLVMDYLPNGNIRRSHPKGTPLPLATIVSYVTQVASALQYAHSEKLIHRDVKPENMLLGKGDTVVLSDFGIALMSQSSRYQGIQEVAGTAAYMAPEQFQGKPRRASDQYALGVVVYEWLSGDRPFHGSFSEIASQHLFVPPPPLHEKLPTISPAVEQVVMTALAKDPNQRFESVKAFANTLEQTIQSAQSHSPILSQAPTILDQSQQAGQNTSPVKPLSQQIIASAQREVIHIPPTLPAQPQSGASSTLNRPESAHLGIPRRTVLVGLGTIGLAIAGGGITWWVRSQKLPMSSTSLSPTLAPTSTPIPLGTTIYTYRGHSGSVQAVPWSPDGKRIASGSWDGTVQVWDAFTGDHVYTYRGHSKAVNAVTWSPNGKHLASGSEDQTVQVWDAISGSTLLTYRGHSDRVTAVAWSPDGKDIVSAGTYDGTAQVWDASIGTTLYTYHDPSNCVTSAAWSPDGKYIASGGGYYNHTVQVWDASTGTTLYTYHDPYNFVTAVAWSPDGKRIASGSWSATVQVWDAFTGNHLYIYRGHANSNAVDAVAWSPDGKFIVSGDVYKATIKVWDAISGSTLLTYRHHTSEIRSVAWSPNSKHITSGSFDKTAQVWQAE